MRALLSVISVLMIATGCNNTTKNHEMKKELGSGIVNTADSSSKTMADVYKSVVMPQKPGQVITVGGEKADIRGFTSEAIQTAIESVNSIGGGTVKILPGTFTVNAPVRVYSNISLIGSGPETILRKVKGFRTRFTIDAGYGELKLTVADASGFVPGMGIEIYDTSNINPWDVTTALITSIEGNTVYIDNYLIRDYTAADDGTVSNACSVISSVGAENVTIADLTVDGNKKENDAINGCRGGGIYLHKVHGALIQNVIVKDFNNDGISWQITEGVIVRNCEIYGCANAGLHPGTGSPQTLIEGNFSHDNDNFGLFVCWRVRNGIVRNNRFINNGENGISTGHMDTDMLYENNTISENGKDGVSLRNESHPNAPHRSIFRRNIVENNGRKNGGYGFYFNSPADGVILENNTIQNTKGNSQKAAIFSDENALPVEMRNNIVKGHPEIGTISK